MNKKNNLRGGYRPGAGRKTAKHHGRKIARFKMRFLNDAERARYLEIGMLERVEYAITYDKNKASIKTPGIFDALAAESGDLAYQTEVKVHFDADQAKEQRALFRAISPRDRVRFALSMHQTSKKFENLIDKLNKQESSSL